MNLAEPADRVHPHVVTVPADTPQGSPATFTLTMPAGRWLGLEIRIPAGHAGETGLALLQSGQQRLPYGTGTYIVGDDDRLDWPLDGLTESGHWTARAYNTDAFAHSFYLRFFAAELDLTGGPDLPDLIAAL